MLVFTAKLNKKKAIIVAAAAVMLIAVIVIAASSGGRNDSQVTALMSVVRDNDDRVDYLASLGWQVEDEPLDTQTILIPSQMSAVYNDYNNIQIAQGFDLSTYGGLEATRYTYKVLNYPGAGSDMNIVADIVVYRNEVIAGDVQSTSMNGFMHGLNYPK